MTRHTGEKPWKHEKGFSQNPKNVYWYNRWKHIVEKDRIIAAKVSELFSQITHLINHVSIHTGKKPYKCDHCEKSFTEEIQEKELVNYPFMICVENHSLRCSSQQGWHPKSYIKFPYSFVKLFIWIKYL